MRLTCPKCGAEYEVPEGLVPEGGKHVQCTDCDTRWFVRGGRNAVVSEDQLIERLENWRPRLVAGAASVAPTEAETAEAAAPPAPAPVPSQERTAPDPGEDAGRVAGAAELIDEDPPEDFVWEEARGPVAPPEPAAEAPEAPNPPPPPAAPAAAPMFRPVIPRETVAARERPADPSPAEPENATREADPSDPDARPIRGRTRNSHRIELPEDGARPADVAGPTAESDHFRTGLLVALAIFVFALGAYAARERIVGAVPATEPALSGYAGAVDGLRQRIDRIVEPEG